MDSITIQYLNLKLRKDAIEILLPFAQQGQTIILASDLELDLQNVLTEIDTFLKENPNILTRG